MYIYKFHPTDLAFEYRQSNQPRPGRIYHTWKLPGGLHSFHRAHLLDVLSSSLSSNTHVHFNSEFDSYSQPTSASGGSGGVTLHLTNGRSQQFDLLVASDGLWSPIRKQMYTELRERGLLTFSNGASRSGSDSDSSDDGEINPMPQWTGTAVFRALINPNQLRAINPQHNALKAPQMVSSSTSLAFKNGTLRICLLM